MNQRHPSTTQSADPENVHLSVVRETIIAVLLNGLVGIIVVAGLWITVVPPESPGRLVQLALGGLVVLGLCLRSRFPWLAAAWTGVVTAVGWSLGMTEDPFLVTGLCLYVAAERFGTRLFPAWLIALEILLFASLLLVSAEGAEASIRGIILGAVIIGAAWVLGIRTQRMRCETERNARAQERLRLARDIHDVLSHTLGGIGVRAGVVAHVKSSTPDDLRSALQGIESDARDALGQLQVLMRQERSETADDAPPGSLPELVRELSQPAIRAGISVVIDADESAHDLPAAQRTTAYRIIQEALTNVIRHSGAGTCRITIRTEGDDLRISVLDDGPGAALASKNGHGLTGMRERAQLLGGTFEAGRETNGYRVAVSLPGTAGRAHSR
ncbi:sensor histidine kinase [Paenarthrobacter nicotinovorans]|uniref:sensor histidine kinase n=1 Tax=Paenarthrobacter nicotinovorans TaxID=29320 RepID=UPI0009C760FD|nr:sensor histidine kinase [Paenarthrobacter nicotinovorans]MDI2020219.1 hypothetical protein [Paenarthrobacter nicotinovorans]SKB80325.1 Signal transduction histidine kinase [Arthrobacter sp. 31Cvi3.1E]